MEDAYSFILSNGQHLHGIKLLRYFLQVLHTLLWQPIVYGFLIGFMLFIQQYTTFRFDVYYSLENIRTPDDTTIYTAIILLVLLVGSISALKCILFILSFWFISYSCECKLLDLEKKTGGYSSIRKVKVNDEEYTTRICLDNKICNKIKKNQNKFVLATNTLTKQCFIV